MSEAEEIPIIFRASALEKEEWNDHEHLMHISDGLGHLYHMLGGGGNKNRQSTIGTVIGVALATAALILTTFGGWR